MRQIDLAVGGVRPHILVVKNIQVVARYAPQHFGPMALQISLMLYSQLFNELTNLPCTSSAVFKLRKIKQLAIGNVVAFVVALLAIKFFIGFLQKHGFKIWGVYRILVGGVILAMLYAGIL